MGISTLSITLLAALALPAGTPYQADMPTMHSVEPSSGKAGDVLVVNGENLGRDHVAALYLTDGKTDVKVAIVEQTDTSIKFKLPPDAKPGRFALLILTGGKDPQLIQEPVRVTVEPETSGAPGPMAGETAN